MTFTIPTLLVAFAGLAAATPAPAADGPAATQAEAPLLFVQSGPGGVKGKVTDSSGNAAEGVDVLLYDMSQGLGGRGGNSGGRGGPGGLGAVDGNDPVALQKGGAGAGSSEKKYGKPVARTKTTAGGTYEFPMRLKPGSYRIVAGDRESVGYRASSVDVKAGEVATKDLQLTPPAAGSGNSGNSGGRGNAGGRR